MLISRLCFTAGLLALFLINDTAAAQSNFHVFGTFGNTNSGVALGGLNHIDDDDGSYALGAGYEFTENISLEAAYHEFGSHDGETDCPPGFTCLIIPVSTQADVTGITLSLIGSIAITDKLDLYGKVGVVTWDIEFSGISSAFDDSGEDMLYGAGLRWSIDDSWKVFAEYGRVQLDLDTASIGVSFHF